MKDEYRIIVEGGFLDIERTKSEGDDFITVSYPKVPVGKPIVFNQNGTIDILETPK